MEKFKELPLIKQIRQSVGLQRFMLLAGLVIIVLFVLTAIFAPLLAPFGFAQTKDHGVSFVPQSAPSRAHLLGTTVGGLDVLSRVIWGSQTALFAIIVSVLASLFLGVLLGLLAGYFGGWLDKILVAIADAIYSFPSLLLAIVMAIVLNSNGGSVLSGILSAGISITVVFVPQYLRVVRSEVLKVKTEAYIDSAKAVGASTGRIIFKHVLKNATRTLPVIITMNAAEAILTLAGLGFLGLGIEPSSASEWGYDLNRAISDVTAGIWWTAVFPGIAIVTVVTGITLLGEGLNDLSDPRLRIRRKPTPFEEVTHD
ncbi:MAG: ABC transporter permease [Streptococcaceae bacterium]|jgi:peptide/nickel transport system permease protein|nr:ABC transporter permease [Streptococcaceae bacterium]